MRKFTCLAPLLLLAACEQSGLPGPPASCLPPPPPRCTTIAFTPFAEYEKSETDYLDSIAIADMDGDCHPDLVTNPLDSVLVLENSGNGTFSGQVRSPLDCHEPSWPMVVADLDGDGRPDVGLTCVDDDGIWLLRNLGGGILGRESYDSVPPSRWDGGLILAGDFDGDGRADLLVAADSGPSVALNLGGFRFTLLPLALPPGAVEAVGDVDGDGKLDLVLDGGVMLGRGDGTFGHAIPYDRPDLDHLFVALGDVDGDGRPDIVVAGPSSPMSRDDPPRSGLRVLINRGGGHFAPLPDVALEFDVVLLALADFDADGRADLALPDYRSGKVHVLSNLTSASPTDVAFPTSSRSDRANWDAVAVSDLDGDGRPDIALVVHDLGTDGSPFDSAVSVLLNRCR